MARIGGPCKHMARMRARRRPFTAPRAGTAKRQEALERLAAAGVAQHVSVDLHIESAVVHCYSALGILSPPMI